MSGREKSRKPGPVKFARPFFRDFTGPLIGSCFATLITTAMSLITPIIFSFIVDSVIGQIPPKLPKFLLDPFTDLGGRTLLLHNLWICGLAIVAVMLVDGFFNMLKGRWSAVFSEGFARKLRQSLFHHIQQLPFSYLSTAETGDLIQRCTSDVDTCRHFFGTQLLEALRCILLVTVTALVMFSVHPVMALISIATTPIIAVTAVLFFRRQRAAFEKWDEAEGSLSTMLQEHLTGVRIVRAFARQDYEVGRFSDYNRTLRDHGAKTMRIVANFWMFSDLVCLIQILVVTLAGTVMVVNNQITLGQLIIFITYIDMLLFPLRQLARILGDAGRMQISSGRLQEILDLEIEPDDSELQDPEFQGRVEFRDVGFTYDPHHPEREVLRNISFTAEPGETIGILGPTGSGKSSLLQLLQRLYDPTAGEILFDGLSGTRIRRSTVRRQVGFVLQEPFVFSRSIYDNIALAKSSATEEAVRRAAKIAVFHDDIKAFDRGYDTLVGERGTTLSGGQKQRLTIARTLLRDCPILIFDDSLSAVDTHTDIRIRQQLKEASRKATVFIVSHRIATLSAADKILVLEKGQITQSGTHESLLHEPGLYSRVYHLQNDAGDDENLLAEEATVHG